MSSATTPATTASTGTGARKMSASTIGIRTTAVAMRLSKGSGQRLRYLHEFKILTTEDDRDHR